MVFPLILIFLGGVFLLQNTGYLPPNFWMNLWRMWPLILVLVGIELLLANRVHWLVLAGLAAIVLVVGGAATKLNIPFLGGPEPVAVKTTSTTDLGNATQAAVTLRFGAGELTLGPIPQPADTSLATMTFEGPRQLAPTPRYSVANGIGQLEYQTSSRDGPSFAPFVDSGSNSAHMDLQLSPNVPITSLNVQTGATDGRLDLSKLRVSTLDMSIGAATTWLRFPENAGVTTAHISGGASTLTLEIPAGVAAQIQHHGGLSTLNVDQSRFPQVSDSTYRSADYDSASNKVDVSIETGVTTITVQ